MQWVDYVILQFQKYQDPGDSHVLQLQERSYMGRGREEVQSRNAEIYLTSKVSDNESLFSLSSNPQDMFI